MSEPLVFVINPGSTSTKAALYEGCVEVFAQELRHGKDELAGLGPVMAQEKFRRAALGKVVRDRGVDRADAVVGRGGLLRPLPGGVYAVNKTMLDDLRSARYGVHASNLGAVLAAEMAEDWGCPAYVVDPVVTDEMLDVARVTGLPGIRRRSIFHALSQKAAARTAAKRLGTRYREGRFIVAHMGGGISIGAHDRGRVVDVVNALDGEGPFSPERAGSVPAVSMLKLMHDEGLSPKRIKTMLLTEGGLWAHFGTNDYPEVLEMARGGDDNARLVLDALAYNVARHMASLVPALLADEGDRLTALVLTGGLARGGELTADIARRLAALGPVVVVTDVEEMRAMADGALAALSGETEVLEY